MDKKKVKELIEQIDFIAHDYIDGDKQEKLQSLVSEVQEELSKSDWVSVEDELPPYGEEVYVRVLDSLDKTDSLNYSCSIRITTKACKRYMSVTDEHDFTIPYPSIFVTHWKPIEKLEE